MTDMEKSFEKQKIRDLINVRSEDFSGYSRALMSEIENLSNRKFKDYLLDLLRRKDNYREERGLILEHLGKKDKMFRLLAVDDLVMVMASEQGNDERFIKYLFEETELTIVQIAVIINQGIKALDNLITSRKWVKKETPQYVDYILLRNLVFTGARLELVPIEKISDPDKIREPFIRILNKLMFEIEQRISRTNLVNSKEIENYERLTNTVGKIMALTIEAHGDMLTPVKEKIRLEEEKLELNERELKLQQLGGSVIQIKSFTELGMISAEEAIMIVKGRIMPLIESEKMEEIEEVFYEIATSIQESQIEDVEEIG